MRDITLQGYESIITNEVYVRKAEPLQHRLRGKVPATQIVVLRKFRIPYKDEVIGFIRQNAEKLDFYLSGNEPLDDDSELINSLKSLPNLFIKYIARNDKSVLAHLRNHCPKTNTIFREGEKYIETSNGIIPDVVLDSAKEASEEIGSRIYSVAISKIGAKEWSLIVRLSENRKFPDFLELEYLLGREVRESKIFSVMGYVEDYQTVSNQVKMLYDALHSPELIAKIKDDSHRILESAAIATIKETAECLESKDVKGIALLVGQVFENLGEQNINGFSLN